MPEWFGSLKGVISLSVRNDGLGGAKNFASVQYILILT